MEKKGTVTEIASLFPSEEAQKASMRVQDAIAERQQQLNQLKGFVNDNVSLINLVKKLPDETHHNIMVPFGKAAFFPGQLIHTNEFMVLLGEGYYAERTSKQTVEILKRRGKGLDTQIESLKAIMQDLEAEASFFDATAQESVEGLVEIREEYVEEEYNTSNTIPPLEVVDRKAATEDEEYARIFSRMAELEKEEEEAEKTSESDDGDDDADGDGDDDEQQMQRQISAGHEVTSTPVETSEVLEVSKGGTLHGDNPALNNSVMDKALELPQEENKIQASSPASNRVAFGLKDSTQIPRQAYTFTGSIVEHPHNNIGVNLQDQTGARSSKPVSRFKMQRK